MASFFVASIPKRCPKFSDGTSQYYNSDGSVDYYDADMNICKEVKADAISGVESRGFLFAAPLAARLNLPLILFYQSSCF